MNVKVRNRHPGGGERAFYTLSKHCWLVLSRILLMSVNYFTCYGNKMPDRGDVRKEGFALTHGLRTMWNAQDHEPAGYIAFPVRTQKEVTALTHQASSLYGLCFLFSLGPRWFCPQLGQVFPSQLSFGKALTDTPSTVSLDSRSPEAHSEGQPSL